MTDKAVCFLTLAVSLMPRKGGHQHHGLQNCFLRTQNVTTYYLAKPASWSYFAARLTLAWIEQ
jgi:hypothetical protein